MSTTKKTKKKTAKKSMTRLRQRRNAHEETITTIAAFDDPEDLGSVLITRYKLVHAVPAGVDASGRVWFVLTLALKK